MIREARNLRQRALDALARIDRDRYGRQALRLGQPTVAVQVMVAPDPFDPTQQEAGVDLVAWNVEKVVNAPQNPVPSRGRR